MNRVGLHIRLNGSLQEVIEKAVRLKLPFFQCFFISLSNNKLIKPSQEEINKCVSLCNKYFGQAYLHGSYWINLAGIKHNGYRALQRELALAKKLNFDHIILHPGSAKGAENKIQGIDVLARALNKILKQDHGVKIVLENTAHGNLSIGSDITDFKILLEKIDQPEKLYFSIDTSHAYSYGYDISNDEEQDAFIELIDNSVGFNRVVLIHLNDSQQKCGSRIDQHGVPGEGRIGESALKRFALHKKIRHIPIVLELPVLPEEQERAILQKVQGWHT